MTEREDNGPEEIRSGDDVVAGSVVIHRGGARSVRAHEVQIKQGGALRVDAEDIEITQGSIAVASAQSASVTAGGVGLLRSSGPVELKAAAAQVVLARDGANLQQSAAGVVAARSAAISDSAVGVLLARDVEARNVRVLFTVPAAIAFGAAAGAALWLLGRVSRR
jgi:hypothetical protein